MKVGFPTPLLSYGVFVLIAFLVLAGLGGEQFTAALRYDRAACMEGELWRLVSGNFVHLDLKHLVWNLLGLLLIMGLFSNNYQEQDWLLILVISGLSVASGFLLFEPELAWYVGFSGILHGLFAAGLLAWIRTASDPFVIVVALLFMAKLISEYLFGSLPLLQDNFSSQIIHAAHFYGAIGGIIAAIGILPKK